MTELERCVANYRSSAETNDALWKNFSKLTDSVPFLKAHRDWVETNAWGFGDRAFHYMWYLLLRDDLLNRPAPRFLEIGIFKGQVVSLWTLIAKQLGRKAEITGVSPFAGNKPWVAEIPVLRRLARVVSKRFREDVSSINLYDKQDYLQAINRIFEEFDLSQSNLKLLQGFSQDGHIQEQLSDYQFDLIYIDGGHRYEEVMDDLMFYSQRVAAGGYLVLDDASFYEPGSEFWKGIESVSRAVRDWEGRGFRNALNIGHNRIMQREWE